MLEPYIIQKYENALEWIKTSVNNGILQNDYIDLTIKWGHDLGKMSKSVEARRAIDASSDRDRADVASHRTLVVGTG